jgi:hypothetical protein
MQTEEIEDVKPLPLTVEEKLARAENKLKLYEENGAAKMYYALNRKMNEIGNLFNETSLEDVDLADQKDKSFDRIFKLIEKSEVIANAAKSLKEFGGITGDEKKDVERKPFVDTIAEKRY